MHFKKLCSTNGKSILPIFTVKLIMLRITLLILATLSFMACTFLIHHIRICPTGYIMIL
ncbi:hypothetical protein LINGRAHAP2_LOCUS21948 [Linum grandiflorum]